MGDLKGCVVIGDVGEVVDSTALQDDLLCGVSREHTGWIISLGLIYPTGRTKNTSLCVILSGFSVSVSNSAEHSGHG